LLRAKCEAPKITTLKPHSVLRFCEQTPIKARARNARLLARLSQENHGMATRERRLAEFNGAGEPPPDQLVQVLCEDHSGTYQLPFACRWVDGEWRNHESGGIVEATVVGWRLHRA
jgi:hypothetical protein